MKEIEFIPFTMEDYIDEITLDLQPLEDKTYYVFIANIAHGYSQIFPDMDNYDIEDRLWHRGVIRSHNRRGSEFCELVIFFYSLEDARGFLDRLNNYISQKIKKFEDALNF